MGANRTGETIERNNMGRRKLTLDEVEQLMTTAEITSLNPLWERLEAMIEDVIPANTGRFSRRSVYSRVKFDTFDYFENKREHILYAKELEEKGK